MRSDEPHTRGGSPTMNADTDRTILTKAVMKAAARFGLTEQLPEILGIDIEAMNALAGGKMTLDPARKEWEAGARFLRLSRLLITMTGTPEQARAWLDAPHHSLGDVPLHLLSSTEGCGRVLRYLDNVQKYEIKLPPPSRHH